MRRLGAIVAAALATAIPSGASAQLGLSLQGYIGSGELIRDLDTDRDVTYGAIAGLHFAGPLSLELEYQHAENDLKGLESAVTLKQDGVFAHVRLDLLTKALVPFVYAGMGWVHYKADATALETKDDRVVVPAGAGLEVRVRPLVLGIRGEYQWIPNDVASRNADYWRVIATAGFRVP